MASGQRSGLESQLSRLDGFASALGGATLIPAMLFRILMRMLAGLVVIFASSAD